MTTKPGEQRRLIPWRKRARFSVGKTRKQRQAQYRKQIDALMLVLLVTVVAGGLVVLFNYRGAGSTKTVSCSEFPEFCVPLAGDAAGFEQLEAATSRELDGESEGAPGVVRYIDANHIPTIGDPNAPIHFITVSDFSCSHCQEFHRGELPQFIKDYVLTGKATFGHAMTTGTGGVYSESASQAALCAGEVGAFWEIGEEFFRLGQSMGVQTAFSSNQIKKSADAMGLDGNSIVSCANSRRYSSFMAEYAIFATDHGVTGTPTVLVSYGDSGEWSKLPDRSYSYLANLTNQVNPE